MKAVKEKKKRRPLSLFNKIVLCMLAAALAAALIYLTYYLFRFVLYDKYKEYLTDYDYEQGTEFRPVKENSPDVPGMELVCENDILKLYTNTETAEIAVYDKRNGKTIYSNPVNAEEDSIANGVNMNYLKSQFIISYYNKEVKSGTYDSYSMSVERGQVDAEGLEKGIRYIYEVGNFEKSKNGTVPVYISEEKLQEIVSLLDEKSGTSLTRYYVSSQAGEDMMELNGVAQKNVKTIAKIQGWLDGIGWTQEDYQEQMELAGVESAMPISFRIALEYRLDGDGLEVSVPVSAIEEYGGGSIYRLQLLRYMGAADVSEVGYMVVPNGAGSLIHFNNGKTGAASYSQYIYDIDPLAANYTTTENITGAKLPLFGICREDSSLLATVEQGKSLALITAGISGVYNDYNYCYPTFVLRTADNLLMFGNSASDVYVLEKEMYDADLTVKYTLLTKEDKGYAGLANYYRERLVAEGVLKPLEKQENIPFYYDVIGGVKETGHFLGVQYLRTFAMTTFEEARQMSDELARAGIGSQIMNFQGWFNGGYYHDAPDTVKVTGKLGGKKELERLSRTVEENGGRFYGDVVFQKVTFADKGFNFKAESSRYYGAGYVVNFGLTNPTTLRSTSGLGYRENLYGLLSPRYLPRYVEKFSDKLENYDITGISLRDLGNCLYSDKKRTNIINREQALNILLGQWEILSASDKNLMADSPNEYAFGYLDDIINAPTFHNEFLIVDEDIPLYEMIVHGSLEYSSELLNFHDEEDMTEKVLNLIEYGASPHYVFTWEESSKMKNTGLNRYYATTFGVWKEEAIEIYGRVNEALKHVSGETMVDHEIFANGVRKVTYSNGVSIYINYADSIQAADGMEIPAAGYRLEGGNK